VCVRMRERVHKCKDTQPTHKNREEQEKHGMDEGQDRYNKDRSIKQERDESSANATHTASN